MAENSHSVGCYDIYELTLSHSGSYGNPWEDVVISAVFRSPSGQTYKLGGFYYDTDTWKLRFAPMEEGSWSWDLTLDNGRATFANSGRFTCTSSRHRGFLRIHPQNPYRFVTDGDNRPFYPLGLNDVIYDQAGPKGFGHSSDGTLDCDWSMDTDYLGWPIDHYFDTFAAAGNNIFRMNTELNTYRLCDKLNIDNTGKNSYRIVEGKLTDQLARKLHEGGWKFYLVFWRSPNLGWDLSDANVRQATLSYHKYVMDRWGAYVDIWELMNEQTSQDDRYIDSVTTFIRAWDPYHHLLSTSNARPDLASIEINSPHRYEAGTTLDIHRLLAGSISGTKTAYAKPVLYGEFGNRYPPYTNYDPERYRIFLWTAMFNEGALVFWHTGYAKNYQGSSSNMFIGPEERAFSRIFSHFIIDFDVLARPIPVMLRPADEIYASALGSGRDIGVYFTHSTSHTTTVSRATVTLDIPDRGMEGLWLDPLTGGVLQRFTIDGGARTLTIPDFQVDIALRIRRAGSNWTPVADAGPDQAVVDVDDDGSEAVALDASRSTDPDGAIASYVWTEDGRPVATGVKPTVPFAVGTHTLTLVVTDDKGATDAAAVVVTVDPADAPTITVLTPRGGESYTVGQTITVTWTSKNLTGNVRIDSNHGGYRWGAWEPSTENDGSWTSFVLPDGVSKYPSTGWKFRVAPATERGPSAESGVFSVCAPPTTNLPPVASAAATPRGGDAPLVVKFSGSGSRDPDGTIVAYRWDFGNGANSNEADPTYVYQQPGTYTVTLTVTDDKGGTGAVTLSIKVGGDLRHISLTALADSWMQDEGGKNRDAHMGALSIMAVGGRWQSTYFRGLVRFDLSSIPDNATVTDARLWLYHVANAVEGSNVNDISIYILQKDWKEDAVTWNYYAADAPWTLPGAAAVGDDRGNTVLATKSFSSTTPINQSYDFDVTSAFRDHAHGIEPEYGFLLVGKETPAANRYFTQFATKESAAAHPPLLEIAYTMPPAVQSSRDQ